jgi:hypothetical protein
MARCECGSPDGTPIILWIDDDEAPPAFPMTVGAWKVDPIAGLSYWRVFGTEDGTSLYFDQHVRGWMPLPPLVFAMLDTHSPVLHHLVLHRIDPR